MLSEAGGSCAGYGLWRNQLAIMQVAGTMATLQQLLDAHPPCPEFRPLEVLHDVNSIQAWQPLEQGLGRDQWHCSQWPC